MIGFRVRDILKYPKDKSVVQSVFEHAVYINSGGDTLVKLITDKDYISPASVVIDMPEGPGFKSADIKEGAEMVLHEGGLSFSSGGFTVDLSRASVWRPQQAPEPASILSLEEINLNMRVLRDVIYTSASREGLVPLLENVELLGPMQVFLKEQKPSVAERARPYIERLMWGLFSGDASSITGNAAEILGLGPGLTPSCDDFLAGLILSLKLGANVFNENDALSGFIDKMAREIISAAKNTTTVYSVSFLSEAALGEAPKPAMDLIYALAANTPDDVAGVAGALIKMGETSGSDAAVGIYYGVRFLISRIELEELNEAS